VAEQVAATKAAAGFSVVDIPAIMRAQGWSIGAALLESWFSRPASTAPAYDVPDVSTVKMSWVLEFGRAKEVLRQADPRAHLAERGGAPGDCENAPQ
jgi:hypothetical protein